MVEANTQSSTFQVVDLPVGTSDETVEDIFSEFGPLKRCFVVRPKVPNKSDKTSGYVQFAFSDDAIKASKVLISYNNMIVNMNTLHSFPKGFKWFDTNRR